MEKTVIIGAGSAMFTQGVVLDKIRAGFTGGAGAGRYAGAAVLPMLDREGVRDFRVQVNYEILVLHQADCVLCAQRPSRKQKQSAEAMQNR